MKGGVALCVAIPVPLVSNLQLKKLPQIKYRPYAT